LTKTIQEPPETSKKDKGIKINFEKSIQEKINSDTNFLKFIRQVELGLKEVKRKLDLKLSCTFELRVDFEIPTWEKIILNVHLIPEKSDFQENIHVWDEIDEVIRGKIKKFLSSHLNGSDKISMNNFNKNFYIEIDPL
jgi:hypothetical protein